MQWQELSINEQLGNVGSEIGRATKWYKAGNNKLMIGALKRAFELLDLTISDPRWQNHRQRELKMAREVLVDTFYGDRQYTDTLEKMEKYFFEFAVAARNKKNL